MKVISKRQDYIPGMHEHEGKLRRDLAPDSAQEELDPHRVGDHQPEDVLVRLVCQQGGGGEERVITLQFPLESHLQT